MNLDVRNPAYRTSTLDRLVVRVNLFLFLLQILLQASLIDLPERFTYKPHPCAIRECEGK